MIIGATFICGASGFQHLPKAISSVIDWVDILLFVDTGMTSEQAQKVKILAPLKAVFSTFAWTNSFADVRNFALSEMQKLGVDWSITVDSDECINGDGKVIRQHLSSLNQNFKIVLLRDSARPYWKERFVRFPTTLSWVGKTHETLMGCESSEKDFWPGITFSEVEKNHQQIKLKLDRDLVYLKAEAIANPGVTRWWFYLGSTQMDLDQFDDAIDSFQKCIDLYGWPEEAGVACFYQAQCYVRKKDLNAAIGSCVRGTSHAPFLAELYWYAAFVNYQLTDYGQAIIWAELSAKLGCFAKANTIESRRHFVHTPALFEGPFDIQVHAFRNLKMLKEQESAQIQFETAKTMRMGAPI
jgi:tetratricopeptide (TPR) repeat protein